MENSASASTKLVPETFRMGQNDGIEVGPGDLKLIYSGNDGKLTQYINGRNSVSHLKCALYFCFSFALYV